MGVLPTTRDRRTRGEGDSGLPTLPLYRCNYSADQKVRKKICAMPGRSPERSIGLQAGAVTGLLFAQNANAKTEEGSRSRARERRLLPPRYTISATPGTKESAV